MPGWMWAFGSGISLDDTLRSAVRLGVVTEPDIELALRHLFSVSAISHFDPTGPQNIPTSAICSDIYSGSSWCNLIGHTLKNTDNTAAEPFSVSLVLLVPMPI